MLSFKEVQDSFKENRGPKYCEVLVYSTLVEAWTTVSTSGRAVWKDGNFEQHITYGSWGIGKVNISRWEFMYNSTFTDMDVFFIKMYKMTYFFLFYKIMQLIMWLL